MKHSLKLPRGGELQRVGKAVCISRKETVALKKKAPLSGELARKRLRGFYNTTYRRIPK